MTQPRECQHHDMRPMPSMKASVCRRCGFYTPLEEDDDAPPNPRLIFWVALAFVLSVAAVVLLRAT